MSSTEQPRYAYLGPAGTFTEQALRQAVDPDTATFVPMTDVVSALEAVRSGEAEFAVVPIENSVEGGVSATLDTLAIGEPLRIVREMVVAVEFVLAGVEDLTLDQIHRIATHPHAWAQCRRWLNRNLPSAVHVPSTSTAAAAKLIASRHPSASFDAVLISPLTAESYDLKVLATHVADNEHAVTRFVMVTATDALPEPTGADKTSLVVHLPDNEAGALLTMLEQFAARGVNLSRIESRPIGDALGRYSFSIDAEGHIANERVAAALQGLHRICPMVRFLGSYPRADAATTAVRRGTRDEDFAAARDWVASLRGSGVGDTMSA